MWMLLTWIMNGIAILGACETARPKANLLKINLLYLIANIYSVVYFGITAQWPYFVLYVVFTIVAIKGIFIHRKKPVFQPLVIQTQIPSS